MSTIMAPLTHVAPAPVITIRVSGPMTADLLKLFSYSGEIKPRVVKNARYTARANSVVDDVLMVYFKAPHSYTGEDVLEISFHGNPMIAKTAMLDMNAMGVRLAEKGEFTKRAYLNQKLSLSQAEAVDALIHANTAEGVGIAYNSLSDKLDNKILDIKSMLMNELAKVEASIDFAEDIDVDHAVIMSIKEELIKIINTYNRSKVAIDGVKIAIIGKPNVGKSSLFNLLLGADRAIVSSEAGTTRDTLSELIYDSGVQIMFTDTAGVREASSIAEKAGIQRTFQSAEQADLLIIMLDNSEERIDENFSEFLKDKECLVVVNKIDTTAPKYEDADLNISTKELINVDKLKDLISEKVQSLLPKNIVEISLIAQRQHIEATNCLNELKGISKNTLDDLMALHLRGAITSLDTLYGGDLSEDTLDIVFSSFCIGK